MWYHIIFAGVHCETNIDECESSPCYGSLSKCVDTVAGWRCDCQPGTAGLRCEEDEDECESSPCKHGGRCMDGDYSYTCDCPGKFSYTFLNLGYETGQNFDNMKSWKSLVVAFND